MAELLAPIATRLVDVLENARGADGAQGADAQALALPAGRYRRAPDRATLRDPALPVAEFDRAYHLLWRDADDWGAPPNPLDPAWTHVVHVELALGFVYGPGNEAMSTTVGAETQAENVLEPSRRALGDARRVASALTFPALVQGGTDPAIVDIRLAGPRTTEDLGSGRLLVLLPLELWLWVTRATAYDP